MKLSVILPLATLLLTSPLAAQGGEEIRGRIMPARGETELPAELTVTLRSLRGNFVQTLPVHTSGNFSFRGVPATSGQYIIELRAPNREIVTRTITIAGGTQSPAGTISAGTAPFMTLNVGRLLETGSTLPAPGEAVSAEWLRIPKKAREELARADADSAGGKHDDAVKHLRKALEIDPDLYHAYNNLAVEYLALNEPRKAIGALEKSIELKPDLVSTHRNLGSIYLDAGKTEQALEHLQRARQIDSSDFETLMLLGEAHYGLEQLPEALAAFEAAAAASPDDPEGHLYVGQCHLRLAHYREAVAGFEAFLRHGGDKDERAAQVRQLIAQLKQQLN